MRVQLLRSVEGKVTGLALFLKPGVIVAVQDGDDRVWRICDHCHQANAQVYCRAHAQYVCSNCQGVHQAERNPTGGSCGALLSMEAARQTARSMMAVGWP